MIHMSESEKQTLPLYVKTSLYVQECSTERDTGFELLHHMRNLECIYFTSLPEVLPVRTLHEPTG